MMGVHVQYRQGWSATACSGMRLDKSDGGVTGSSHPRFIPAHAGQTLHSNGDLVETTLQFFDTLREVLLWPNTRSTVAYLDAAIDRMDISEEDKRWYASWVESDGIDCARPAEESFFGTYTRAYIATHLHEIIKRADNRLLAERTRYECAMVAVLVYEALSSLNREKGQLFI